MRGPPPEIKGAPPLRDAPVKSLSSFAGPLNSTHNKTLADIQASRLSRLYALSFCTASTIAHLAFGVCR
jgi:hypothetical protein